MEPGGCITPRIYLTTPKKRVRKNLGTQDVEEARQLRDKILTAFAA